MLKDFSFLDAYYESGMSSAKKISPELVLVNIENTQREDFAKLISLIEISDPKVIGLDVIFRASANKEVDKDLAKLFSNQKIIGGNLHFKTNQNLNNILFKDVNRLGFVNLTDTETNHVIKHFEGIKRSGDNQFLSFTSVILKNAKGEDYWKALDYDTKLAEPRRIKYYGHYDVFKTVNASSLIKHSDSFNFKNKIVLVGYLGSPIGNVFDIEDKHFTPLNSQHIGKGIPDMYGLTIHANILNMLLLNDFFWEPPLLLKLILIFISSYLANLYFIWLDRKVKISYRTIRKLVLFLFSVSLVGVSLWLFTYQIAIEPSLIIVTTIFSAGFVKYYKHLIRYLKTKRKFKTYIK